MTYTTQQLQAMSDFERNKAIAIKLYPDAALFRPISDNETDAITIVHGGLIKTMVDYCNNPSDSMPLMERLGIKLGCVACPAGSGFVYYAKSYDGKLQSDYDSACRAIACLILMMED